MGENSDLPVKGYHIGRFWDCRLCGKPIDRGEEYVLAGTRPTQRLYLTHYGAMTQIFERGGRMYHKECYRIKERQEAASQENKPEKEARDTIRDNRHIKPDNEFNF